MCLLPSHWSSHNCFDSHGILRLLTIIGGLGDFGFGTKQRLQSLRDTLQEDDALQLRAGDLDHIVDEVSEGEGDEEEGERRRREMEEAEDWQRTKVIGRYSVYSLHQ